jgi:hypothetical protein
MFLTSRGWGCEENKILGPKQKQTTWTKNVKIENFRDQIKE